ncbi:hypothetical protein KBY91_11180 [Streptomyces sp. RK23]|uniref:hypothetical protein n=1 Tax=Streptomyces TaxID=1883 RepID=UPI001B375721|nr:MULTISPECIES: hypothetical protein [unclassified Streptomyces]MBQ0964075.1 hypothetical protein [Streptomyces sp. RK74B]MBQ1003973.1 hypothetical protein [Streptomyces sp. RK23]
MRQAGYGDESGLFSVGTTTNYEIVGRSRVRWTEAVRTYLACWIVMPAALVVPNVVAAAVGWEDENAGFYRMIVSVGLLFLLLTLFYVCAGHWSPVREARWAEGGTGGTDGRRRQGLASTPSRTRTPIRYFTPSLCRSD